MTEIPLRALGDIATVLRGTVPAKPTDSDDGVPFFGITEITAGGTGDLRRVDLGGDAALKARKSTDAGGGPVAVQSGDVVVALMSNIGQAALVSPRHAGAVLGRECALIRPADEVTGAWIYAWTQSTQFRDQVTRHTSGSTMPRLSYRALADMVVPVPPDDQQLRAEQLLADFDDALRKIDAVRAYLTELRTLELELLLGELDGAA